MTHPFNHVALVTLVLAAAIVHAQPLDTTLDSPTRLTVSRLAPPEGSESETEGSPRVAAANSYTQPPVDMWTSPKRQVTSRAKRSGLDSKQIKCLHTIIERESNWNPQANNKHSTAYGLFQQLKLNTNTTTHKQITLGFRYIKHRYGTPCAALEFHNKHGWY